MSVLALTGVFAGGCASGGAGSDAEPEPAAPESRSSLPSSDPVRAEIVETYEVVRTYPHDAEAFTQGLAFRDGFLYEGTGQRGASSLRRVDVQTGDVLEQVDLPGQLFGEGITVYGDRIYQLTWLSGVGLVYDLESMAVRQQFRQFTEGWGLTHDGTQLILSDGSARLYFLDPDTMLPERDIEVHGQAGPVDQLNELEFIDGEIFANVWHSDEILRISPRDGRIIGRIDMSGIIEPGLRTDPEAVLNGIAYDAATGRVFVTGKLWPKLFEVRFVRSR